MLTPNRLWKVIVLLALLILPAACIGPRPAADAQPATSATVPAADAVATDAVDTADAELVGVYWELSQIATRDGAVLKPSNPAQYTLAFGEDGRVVAQIGCNRGTGAYQISGDRLTFGAIASSMAACPPGSIVDDFTAGLADATSYSIEGNTLSINTRIGVMQFVATAVEDSNAMDTATPEATPEATSEPTAETAVSAAITGTVIHTETNALPSGAVLSVRLVDISRADAPAELVAEQTIATEGQPVPLSFELTYDPARIVEGNSYAVQAFIEVDGQLLFISDTIVPVITNGAPTSGVEIMVTPVSSPETPATEGEGSTEGTPAEPTGNGLTGVVWQWQNTQMNDGSITTPTTPANYTLEFGADGTVALQADCNGGSGPYTVEGNQLTFGAIATTLMGCPEGSQADAYLQQLSQVGSYFITEEGNLVLELQVDSGSMIFVPAQ